MVFNATFNNFSIISCIWQSFFSFSLVDENGVLREKITDLSQVTDKTLSRNVV